MAEASVELTELLTQLRPRLLAFARLQLRSAAAAEDVVQEALLAALDGMASHKGQASLSTWVFAILKNKIIDEFRRNRRYVNRAEDIDSDPEAILDLFDHRDHWLDLPAAWGDPARSLEDKRFWEVLDACLTRLPSAHARVFMMREMLDMENSDICKELSISPSNCWVHLHRARLSLRTCLGKQWFEGEPS